MCRICSTTEMIKNEEYTILSYRKNNFTCEFVLTDRALKKSVGSGNYHFHSAHEIHVCVGGAVSVTVEEEVYELTSGDLCVIPKGHSHYLTLPPGGCTMGFRFRFSCVGKEPSEEYENFTRAFSAPDRAIVVRNSGLLKKYVSHASENLKNSGSPLISAGLLFLSLCDLADSILGNEYSDVEAETRHQSVALSEKIEQYLNFHYNQKPSIIELAAELNLGVRQTERTVKKLFGQTYGELLSQKRICVAKLLLRSTDRTLDSIAEACGFEDKTYFCRRFTRAVGISPGKYRASRRQ